METTGGQKARLRKISEKEQKKKKALESGSDVSLISYTEFADLRRIIANNWDAFQDTFKTQTGIVGRLEELESIRNKIAHSRLLSNDDLAKLELFFKEITSLIPKA